MRTRVRRDLGVSLLKKMNQSNEREEGVGSAANQKLIERESPQRQAQAAARRASHKTYKQSAYRAVTEAVACSLGQAQWTRTNLSSGIAVSSSPMSTSVRGGVRPSC